MSKKKDDSPRLYVTEKEWQDRIGIFRSYLKSPNESCWDLANLRYGRSDYAHILEVPPTKNKANEKFYSKTELNHWRVRPNWRALLDSPDPWALVPIHVDPTNDWTIDDGGILRREYVLWNPMRLFASVCCPGVVCDGILTVINQPGLADLRPLTKALSTHFRTVYMPEEEKAWKSIRYREDGAWWEKNYTAVTWEQHKSKTLDCWDSTAHLVAGCLLHNFQVWPDVWMNHLHGSSAIEDLFFEAKIKLEIRKTGGLDFEFA